MDDALWIAWMPGESLVIILGGKLNLIIKTNLLDFIRIAHVCNNLRALHSVKDKNLRLSLLLLLLHCKCSAMHKYSKQVNQLFEPFI